MMDISTRLGDTPLYRRKLTSEQAGEPYVLICKPEVEEEAYQYCLEMLDQPPEAFIDYGKKATNSYPEVARVQISQYLDFVECNVVVYGIQPSFMGLAMRLALQGIKDFLYAVPDWNVRKVKFDPEYIRDNLEKIESCFKLLLDSESRRVFCSVLKYRVTGDHGYIRASDYQEYNHPMVNAEGCDWVIDAGAANGETSFAFSKRAKKNATVIAIEPDQKNIEKLKKKLPKFKNVILEAYALGKDKEKVYFRSGRGGSSSVVNNPSAAEHKNVIEVECISLPTLHTKHDLKGCGLISFDIEGMEMPVLQQDIGFIRDIRPKLQVSIYHKVHDLTDILIYLADSLPNYEFYMGHHSVKHTETDLYCIPKELLEDNVPLKKRFFSRWS